MVIYWDNGRGARVYESGPAVFVQTNSVEGMPLGVALSVGEARELADALNEVCDAITSRSSRCHCGEPMEIEDDECFSCHVEKRNVQRRRLTIVDGGRSHV